MAELAGQSLENMKNTNGRISRLRVLVVSDAIASRNGVGSYYADLVGHLTDYIGHAELVSPGSETADYAHALSFPLPGDPTQRVYLPKAAWIWDKVKTVSPDVMVVPTPGPYGLLGLLIARYMGIPLCAGYHTRYEKLTEMYWTTAFSGFSRISMKWLNRVLFSASERVVGNSAEMITEAERDGAVHAEMIGTPIARPFLTPPFRPLSPALESVCYAGRLALEKNISEILEAAERLPHIRFTIAGDGPLRETVAGRAQTAPNIEYVGWVSRGGVKAVIDRADMLLLPSEVESFGTIALEAMARRRLVLVSGNCGILNWPDLSPGVYAISAGESLADAVHRISTIPTPVRRQKAELAYEAAKSFNDQTIRQWIALFASIASLGREAVEDAKRAP
jgi:glycosyltransferase involved in cell wall biosynthesis